MQTRRAQQAITIRSDRAAARLALLTRDGRSQARVIEDALDQVPVPPPIVDDEAEFMAAMRDIAALYRQEGGRIRTMAEFDAEEYDADGNPR